MNAYATHLKKPQTIATTKEFIATLSPSHRLTSPEHPVYFKNTARLILCAEEGTTAALDPML